MIMAKIKNTKPKCYIYMRVSTEMQVDGYSLEAQKERLTKFADYQGMEVVREYCDAGKSGKNITDLSSLKCYKMWLMSVMGWNIS